MNVIELNPGCFVLPQAIQTIRTSRGLTEYASQEVQDEVKSSLKDPHNPYEGALIPSIEIGLIDKSGITLHFATEAKRDERLAELIKLWREE